MSYVEVVDRAMVYLRSVIQRRRVARWACCVRKMGHCNFECDYIQVVMNLIAIQQRALAVFDYENELQEWLQILSYFQKSGNKVERRISTDIHTKLIEELNKPIGRL